MRRKATFVEPKKAVWRRFTEDKEVATLVARFEDCSLPHREWVHPAHLTVSLWYLRNHPREIATVLIRDGIKRYNSSKGIITTDTNGYHETVTLFFVWAVHKYLNESSGQESLAVLANGLIDSPIGKKEFPLTYYSRERIQSREARYGWLEPDLKPLD
jgi:hypothetical protein